MENYVLEKARRALSEVEKEYSVLGAVIVGSHLHGTATEESDIDLHVIYRPNTYDMLMGTSSKCGRFGAGDNDKMVPGQVDIKLIPLHKFLTGLVHGDIGYTEALFAEPLKTTLIFDELKDTSSRAATENIFKNAGSIMRAVVYRFVDKDGYWMDSTDDMLVKCQEGSCKNHIDLAHIHRILHELYGLISLGRIRYGEKFYNPKLYAKVKSGVFSADDIHLMIEEIVKIYKMIGERRDRFNFSNQYIYTSFERIVRMAHAL